MSATKEFYFDQICQMIDDSRESENDLIDEEYFYGKSDLFSEELPAWMKNFYR